MGFALTLTLSRSGIACFLLAMMLSAFHAGYWLRLGAVTGLVAIAFQEIVEFSLQMPGNAAFFTVLCAIAVRKASVKGARPQQR